MNTNFKFWKHLRLILALSLGWNGSALAAEQIITFGDSITSGVKQDAARTVIFCAADGVTTPPPYVCNGNGIKDVGGYQPYVKNALAAQGIAVDQYNWGFAGKESDQLLGDIFSVMAARPSDYVFIMVGINDVNEAGYSTATSVFNIERIIDAVIDDGRIPILGTVTPWLGNSTFNARIQQINIGIKAYAEQPDIRVTVADHYAALIGNFSSYHTGDGVHLRSAGNAVVGNLWADAFIERMNQISPGGALPGIQLLLLD